MDFAYIGQLFTSLAGGLKYTVGLFAVTILFSVPLGLGLAFIRVGKNKFLNSITGGYILLMRGTPLLLQLFFFYYGVTFLPFVGEYITYSRFTAACIAFILNYAAYFAEIFRGGMLSIDPGQKEAAKVLGFSKMQTVFRVIIPQMLRVSLPSLSNECITLVKDTALIASISIADILFFAKAAVNRDFNVMGYVIAAIIYLVMTFGLTKLFSYLEKKFKF
ncbi:MAG: amino acid ABC transporter permease [Oscillospiraceae bacterium]